MAYGELSIDLIGTEIKVDEPKTWLQKIARVFSGEKKISKEVVTQMQYLQKLQEICKELGYKNVLSLDVNGINVYFDEEYNPDDLDKAMELALKEEQSDMYHVELILQGIEENDDNQMEINMYSSHGEDELPIVVTVDIEKTIEETRALLEKFKEKVNTKFGIEEGEISVDGEEVEETEKDEEDEKEEGL